IDPGQRRSVRPNPDIERLSPPAIQPSLRQGARDTGKRLRLGQRDAIRGSPDRRKGPKRLHQQRGHPADSRLTHMKRDPGPRQDGVVAGAHVALEAGLFRVLIQAARLSKKHASCHIRSMRRSSARRTSAVLPAGLQVRRSTLQTVRSLLPYLWPAGNIGARIRVVIALVFMLLAKVATVYVSVVSGRFVEDLAPH